MRVCFVMPLNLLDHFNNNWKMQKKSAKELIPACLTANCWIKKWVLSFSLHAPVREPGTDKEIERKSILGLRKKPRVLRLQAGHKYCLLGRLSSEVGWNHYETIRELENKRKDRAQTTYEKRKQLTRLRVKAENIAEEKLGSQLEIIAPIKY